MDHHESESTGCKEKATSIQTRTEEAISNTPRSARNQYTTQVQKHITEATDTAKKLAVELKNKREKRRRPQTDEPESEAPPAKQARPDRNVMKEMVLEILQEKLQQPETKAPIQKLTNSQQSRRTRTWKGWQKLKAASHKRKYHKKTKKLSNSKHLANENNIVNLSTYTLSKDELSLLNKGLSFIPKPKRVDTNDITEGISKLKNSKTIKSQHRSTVPDSYNPFLTLNKFREVKPS